MNELNKNSVFKLVLLILWFILSLVSAGILCNQDNSNGLFLIVVGQIFAVIGSIFLLSSKNLKTGILKKCRILTTVGILMIIVGVTVQWNLVNWNTLLQSSDSVALEEVSRYVILTIAVGFVILAIYLTVDLLRTLIICSEECYAVCVSVKSHASSHSSPSSHGAHLVYCPVYKIDTPQGEVRICNESFSNFHVPVIGEKYKIHVDPKDYRHFYDARKIKSSVSMIIVSLLFIIVIYQIYLLQIL